MIDAATESLERPSSCISTEENSSSCRERIEEGQRLFAVVGGPWDTPVRRSIRPKYPTQELIDTGFVQP
jgi:hypothetical protein